ncbi:MAG: hypothetical protein IGS49_21765 [Chlorogloeopsis fritschii C42_A2020_084]|uniref:hypothetical protein n=1 Tax=Chlorogloeopsis fritschii TaxID=1124 RepID=UPI0019F9326B|nr:hypothetical protein [Chlorogloeopsis fritschii]MBF2007995.1 hypothetical protein [Chlorogloeopsis fritschii C42_A2020_084]
MNITTMPTLRIATDCYRWADFFLGSRVKGAIAPTNQLSIRMLQCEVRSFLSQIYLCFSLGFVVWLLQKGKVGIAQV